MNKRGNQNKTQPQISRRSVLGTSATGLVGGLLLGSKAGAQQLGISECRGLMPAPVITFDPHKAVAISDGIVCPLVYEGLVRSDDQGIYPAIAESWQASPNNLIWSFKIREGILFHNRRELKSSDVLFSFKRLLSDDEAFMHSTYLNKIQTINAPNDYDVEFVLNWGGLSFLWELGLCVRSAIIPPEAVNEDGTMTDFIGSGRFRYDAPPDNNRVEVVAFDGHRDFGELGDRCPKIVLEVEEDNSQRAGSLLDQQADFAFDIPYRLSSDASLSEYSTALVDVADLLRLNFNHRRAPFNDRAAREFVASAIDRDAINEAAFGGLATVADQPFGDQSSLFLDVPENANLMTQRSNSVDDIPAFSETGGQVVFLNLAGYMEEVVDTIIADLEQRGLTVELVTLPAPQALARLQEFDFDLVLLEQSHVYYWGRLLEYFHHENRNNLWVGGYRNDQVSASLDEAARLNDLDAARAKYTEILRVLQEDVAAVFLLNMPLTYTWPTEDGTAEFVATAVGASRDPF